MSGRIARALASHIVQCVHVSCGTVNLKRLTEVHPNITITVRGLVLAIRVFLATEAVNEKLEGQAYFLQEIV